MTDLACPRCGIRLTRRATARGFKAVCVSCDGRIADNAALRHSIGQDDVDRIWARLDKGKKAGIDCPMCGKVMRVASVEGVMLDGCPDHDVIWFDGSEINQFRTGLAPADRSRVVSFVSEFLR